MLIADRASAMVLETVQFDAVLRESGGQQAGLEPVLTMLSPTSNLAFSLDVPMETVQRWQTALNAMKKDGSYISLHNKWFPVSAIDRR